MGKNGKTGRKYSAKEEAATVWKMRTPRAELGAERRTAWRVALHLGMGRSLFGSGRDRWTLMTL